MSKSFWIVLIVIVGMLPSVTVSEPGAEHGVEPGHGLIWQSTGLPAVFPLQVKTHGGRNYYLQLRQVETGEPMLAAFIEGGRFFKVLVPPGRFNVWIAAGRAWQGEETLFGQGTQTAIIRVPDPLTFETRGFGRKAGHLIDLTKVGADQRAEVLVRPQSLCQTYGIAPDSPRRVLYDPYDRFGLRHLGLAGTGNTLLRYPAADLFSTQIHPLTRQFFRDRIGRLGQPRPRLKYKVRSRVC